MFPPFIKPRKRKKSSLSPPVRQTGPSLNRYQCKSIPFPRKSFILHFLLNSFNPLARGLCQNIMFISICFLFPLSSKSFIFPSLYVDQSSHYCNATSSLPRCRLTKVGRRGKTKGGRRLYCHVNDAGLIRRQQRLFFGDWLVSVMDWIVMEEIPQSILT